MMGLLTFAINITLDGCVDQAGGQAKVRGVLDTN
jgi:hypothetical protein